MLTAFEVCYLIAMALSLTYEAVDVGLSQTSAKNRSRISNIANQLMAKGIEHTGRYNTLVAEAADLLNVHQYHTHTKKPFIEAKQKILTKALREKDAGEQMTAAAEGISNVANAGGYVVDKDVDQQQDIAKAVENKVGTSLGGN